MLGSLPMLAHLEFVSTAFDRLERRYKANHWDAVLAIRFETAQPLKSFTNRISAIISGQVMRRQWLASRDNDNPQHDRDKELALRVQASLANIVRFDAVPSDEDHKWCGLKLSQNADLGVDGKVLEKELKTGRVYGLPAKILENLCDIN